MKDVSIACIQTVSEVATPSYVDGVLRQATSRVDLAVLPEICNVPYFPLEANSLDAEAPVAIDGPEVAAFGEVARKHRCYLMLGLYLAEGRRRFNGAVLLGPDGKIVSGRTRDGGRARSYHKVHLCDVNLPTAIFCESAYFEPGGDYVAWDLPFGCVGALICYDRHFPEAWIALREMGAEIVCVPTTSPLSAASYFVPEIQGMAVTQSVYAACANRVGRQVLRTTGRTSDFLGSSLVAGPIGEVIVAAPAREEIPLISATLSAKALADIRRAHQFHERRRPDTYIAARREKARQLAE
jgi:N-carbamoylputrescine amidase